MQLVTQSHRMSSEKLHKRQLLKKAYSGREGNNIFASFHPIGQKFTSLWAKSSTCLVHQNQILSSTLGAPFQTVRISKFLPQKPMCLHCNYPIRAYPKLHTASLPSHFYHYQLYRVIQCELYANICLYLPKDFSGYLLSHLTNK